MDDKPDYWTFLKADHIVHIVFETVYVNFVDYVVENVQ